MTINNFRDTIKALLDGRKIKREDWSNGEFTQLSEGGQLVDEMGNAGYVAFYTDGCYEIYEEPREELKLENLMVGDILEGIRKGEKSKIIGICGEVIAISTINKDSQAGGWFTWFSIKTLNNLKVKKCN